MDTEGSEGKSTRQLVIETKLPDENTKIPRKYISFPW